MGNQFSVNQFSNRNLAVLTHVIGQRLDELVVELGLEVILLIVAHALHSRNLTTLMR